MLIPLLFFALSTQPAPTPSVYFYGGTAAELVQKCRNVKILDNADTNMASFADLQACGSYLQGVVDGINVDKLAHPTDVFFCVPQEVTKEEFVRVVLKYGDDHPEKLHLSSIIFVIQAFSSAFPCSGQK
jgi:hypothetical protein